MNSDPAGSKLTRRPLATLRVAPNSDRPLTQREDEVLALLLEGCATKEVASRLGVSFDTVRFHLKNIYEKLDVHSRTEAVLKRLR